MVDKSPASTWSALYYVLHREKIFDIECLLYVYTELPNCEMIQRSTEEIVNGKQWEMANAWLPHVIVLA